MAISKHGRGADQVSLRLPDGLRNRVKAEADRNGRSMNAEIVARLDGVLSLDEDGYTRLNLPSDLLERIDAYASSIATIPEKVIVETLEKAFPYTPTFAEYVAGVADEIEWEDGTDPAIYRFIEQVTDFLRDHPELARRRTQLRERPAGFAGDE